MQIYERRGLPLGSTADVLTHADYGEIHNGYLLVICYLGMFLAAEAAFILMAIREYLQDLLGLTDVQLITNPEGVAIGNPPPGPSG